MITSSVRPSKYRKPSSSARTRSPGPPRAGVRRLAEVAQEERRVGRGIGRTSSPPSTVERDARERAAHRAGPRPLAGRHPGELAGLRLAVAVADPQAGRLVPGAEHAGVERLARGHQPAQPGRRPRLPRAWRSRGTPSAPCRGRPRARARATSSRSCGSKRASWSSAAAPWQPRRDERVARGLRPARAGRAPDEVARAGRRASARPGAAGRRGSAGRAARPSARPRCRR